MVFSLMPHRKMARFLVPVMPSMAIIIAYGIHNMKNLTLKKIFVSGMILFGLFQFFDLSFGIPDVLNKIKFQIEEPIPISPR